MDYTEGLMSRALKRVDMHLKKKDKYRRRVNNRQKLYKKKLKLNRRL